MTTPSTAPGACAYGHEHAEAFSHMLYRTDDERAEEWVWNSRDGVTPFVISIEGRQATHVEWHRDRYDPGYRPQLGERIFVDLTEERGRQQAERMVERWWDDPTYPMRERWATRRDAEEDLFADIFEHPTPEGGRVRVTPPDLVVFDEAVASALSIEPRPRPAGRFSR